MDGDLWGAIENHCQHCQHCRHCRNLNHDGEGEHVMTEQSKSWRDVIKVHPAADLFPMMTPDELKALAEDISKHDVLIPVTLWGPDAILLDGRNRLEALALAGFSAVDETSRRLSDHVRFRRLNEDVDPVSTSSVPTCTAAI
jgi:hypothetical protein